MAKPIEVTAYYYTEVLVTCPICGNESSHRDTFECYLFDDYLDAQVPVSCPYCKTELMTVKYEQL